MHRHLRDEFCILAVHWSNVCPDKNIFDVVFIFNIQIDIPVNAAVCHIVDHITKRWNIQVLPAVYFHDKDIFFSIAEYSADIHRKSCVSTVMFSHFLPI